MTQRTYLVPFIAGDGTEEIMLTVVCIAEYPRGVDDTCAYCHGDPCAERSAPGSLIAQYYARNGSWAVTCPCCDGRPT